MAPRNLSEQLLHELGNSIVQGELQPGDVLPKVETLSEMKGVSRTVVREALKGLSARRLVESSTKVGTVVKERNDWLWWDPDVLSWATKSKGDRQILLQLSDVRLAIEPAAVRLAAKNATEDDLDQIRDAYSRLEASLDNEQEWAKADYEFHHSILQASHNELMISLVRTMRRSLFESRKATIKVLQQEKEQSSQRGERTEVALAMHKDVMEAICTRDDNRAYEKMHELILFVVKLIEDYNEAIGQQ